MIGYSPHRWTKEGIAVMTPRTQHRRLLMPALFVALAVVMVVPIASIADHESDNELTFEPVADSASPAGSGTGTIEYRGGVEPESRWTLTFQFVNLDANANYVTVVRGRFGEDDSPEANEYTALCSFRSDANGDGGCWHYLVGLRRLAVVQVRLGDEAGQPVLQATKEEGGQGSLTGIANFHSLQLTATPREEGANREASPVATP